MSLNCEDFVIKCDSISVSEGFFKEPALSVTIISGDLEDLISRQRTEEILSILTEEDVLSYVESLGYTISVENP